MPLLFSLALVALAQRPLDRQIEIFAEEGGSGAPIATLPAGTVVQAIEQGRDGWTKIKAPPSVRVWVWGELIRDGKAVTAVNVRSGPSIEHPVVGSLESGEAVEVFQGVGDWKQIGAPSRFELWMRAEGASVTPVPARPPDVAVRQPIEPPRVVPGPTPSPTTPRREEPEAPRREEPEAAPSAPTRVLRKPSIFRPPLQRTAPVRTFPAPPRREPAQRDTPVESAGSDQAEGILRPSGPLGPWDASFRLVSHDRRGRPVTVAYVVSPDDLSRHVGERVVVEGVFYDVLGLRHPLIEARRVVAR